MTPTDLRSTRKRLGLTQPEFAAAIGLSLRHLAGMETGEREITLTIELAVLGYLAQRP